MAMKPLSVFRGGLQKQFPEAVRPERECTCGAPYHVRLIPFRIDGRAAIAIIPEGMTLAPEEMAAASGAQQAERLPTAELEPMLAPFAPARRRRVFGDPRFPALYFDESLLAWPEIVFCPRMFFGRAEECFRTATETFLEMSGATVVPLTPARVPGDEWGV